MISELAEFIRKQTLTVVAPSLSAPIDRTFLTVGDLWARDGCRQWVVSFGTIRRNTLGAGPTAAVQGAGFAGAAAAARTVDLRATFVACGYPVSDDERPPDQDAITTFAQSWLDDVEMIDQALAALELPVELTGAPSAKLAVTTGGVEPWGPQAGLARATWPLSVSLYL